MHIYLYSYNNNITSAKNALLPRLSHVLKINKDYYM